MLLFYEGYIILVSHPNTNPAEQGLTSVNFGITKLSDASEGTLKLVVKKKFINMSAQKPMFLTSHLFSSIFLGSVLC